MTKKEYEALLLLPQWQKKRLEAFDYYGWQCCECGNKERQLHVHHRKYKSYDSPPWDCELADLIVLCHVCHANKNPDTGKLFTTSLSLKLPNITPVAYTEPKSVCVFVPDTNRTMTVNRFTQLCEKWQRNNAFDLTIS